MADRYVWSGGSDTAPYESWATAATAPNTAIAAAAAGERVYVHAAAYTLSADTTLALADGVEVICSNDTTNAPPQTLGTQWELVNTSGTSGYDLTINGVGRIHRLKYHASASTALALVVNLANTDADNIECQECVFDLSNSSSASSIVRAGASAENNSYVRLIDCDITLGSNASSAISNYCQMEMVGGSITKSATTPTSIFVHAGRSAVTRLSHVDLSGVSAGTLIAPGSQVVGTSITFEQCKLNSGATYVGSFSGYGQGEYTFFDCAAGDEHYHLLHYSVPGNLSISTGIYANDGAEYNESAAKYSWRIDTSSYASRATPYVSPWIRKYNEATSAITPAIEGLRSSSSDSAYATTAQDDEIWGEFAVKTSTGSTLGTYANDACGPLATPANQTSSLTASDWTGEQTHNSTFKLAAPSSMTPAEIGDIMARVVVAAPSLSYYIDPQIRT